MAYKRLPWALLALSSVLTSCASPPVKVDGSVSAPAMVQPVLSSQVLGPTKKSVSESVKEADCVLSSGTVHLWCTWVSRYY